MGAKTEEEIRFLVIKAMLDDFPQLRTRIKKLCIQNNIPKQQRKGSTLNSPPSRLKADLSSS